MTAEGTTGLARYASFDGTEIAYLDEGEGDLVVLLHGFGSQHRENWVETGVVAGLLAAGRRVVAPDARGHGASARPHDPAAYAGNAMVGDARALLDHLGVTEPRSVDVAGYSMGSVVAARWVPEDERVRSLVLGGVGVNIANGARLAIKGLAAAWRTVPGDHLTACASSEFPAAIVDFVTSPAPTHPSEDPVP